MKKTLFLAIFLQLSCCTYINTRNLSLQETFHTGSLSIPTYDILEDIKELTPGVKLEPHELFIKISAKNNYAIIYSGGSGSCKIPLLLYTIDYCENWVPIDTSQTLLSHVINFITEPSGTRLLFEYDKYVYSIIDTQTWSIISTIRLDDVCCINLTDDGKYVIFLTEDCTLYVFDSQMGEEIQSFENVHDFHYNTFAQKDELNPREFLFGIHLNDIPFVYNLSAKKMELAKK